jgi:hypothetical protein
VFKTLLTVISLANRQSQTSSQRPSRIPRYRFMPSNSRPPVITNTSVQAQRSEVVPFQPPNAQFQDAENVVVTGGQFTNARGHHVVNNVVINLPKRIAGFNLSFTLNSLRFGNRKRRRTSGANSPTSFNGSSWQPSARFEDGLICDPLRMNRSQMKWQSLI